MIITGNIEIPDSCPVNCPFTGKAMFQGDMCCRCPVFNCKSEIIDIQLLKPEEYREDWGKEFKLFFDSLEGDSRNYRYPILFF
jgi:hypothetical protein